MGRLRRARVRCAHLQKAQELPARFLLFESSKTTVVAAWIQVPLVSKEAPSSKRPAQTPGRVPVQSSMTTVVVVVVVIVIVAVLAGRCRPVR